MQSLAAAEQDAIRAEDQVEEAAAKPLEDTLAAVEVDDNSDDLNEEGDEDSQEDEPEE